MKSGRHSARTATDSCVMGDDVDAGDDVDTAGDDVDAGTTRRMSPRTP